MSKYHHFTKREKNRLYAYLQMGKTVEFISEKIGKHRSSIYRELKRNKQGKYYLPDTANKQYLQRRSRLYESKICTDSKLYCQLQ